MRPPSQRKEVDWLSSLRMDMLEIGLVAPQKSALIS